MANQFTVQGVPVFIAADPNPKRISVFGNDVAYGDQGVHHANANGKVSEGKSVVFAQGQWFVSEGSSLLTVEEVPGAKADVKPEAEPKKSKPKSKPKAVSSTKPKAKAKK